MPREPGWASVLAMTTTRIRLLTFAMCLLAFPTTEAVAIQPAGTGEPAYTNSQQNTQFFEWSAESAIDARRIQFSYLENNASKGAPTYDFGTSSGSASADWSGIATLQHGSQYGVCAQEQHSFPGDPLFFSSGANSCAVGSQIGRPSSTTIDRSKPTAQIQLAAGAAYTTSAQIGVRVNYADDVAPPFPANFLCFQWGGGPADVCNTQTGSIFGYNAACSVPAQAAKVTTFDCTAHVAGGATPAPDGPVWACAIAADASIPDNPTNANQAQSADKANLSNAVCDSVVLDRAAPAVAIDASATTVRAGDLVSFDAEASDATSGLSGAYDWTWGDGTSNGSGAATAHTFAQPGTYQVQLTASDAAGHSATATRSITVVAATVPGVAGAGAAASGATASQVVPQPAGAGAAAPGAAESRLDVEAPRKLRLPRAKTVHLALTAATPGRVGVALVRRGAVIATGGTRVAAGTRAFRLRLPRKATAGSYALKVTFTPDGGAASTQTLKVALAGKVAARPSARKARAASARAAATVSPEGAPVALPTGRPIGDAPTRFTARVG